jgi:NADPH2:quinone reductase
MAKKPVEINHVEAAVLLLALVTAWEALYDRINIQAGETVLIHAGGGGVGHLAIQLAKLRGAKVVTTASSTASINLVRALGADVVINHKTDDFVKVISDSTGGKGISAIFDCVGGEVFDRSLDCLSPCGRIATIVEGGTANPSAKLFFKNATVHYVFIGAPLIYDIEPERQGHIIEQAAKLVAENKLRAHVSHVLTLEQLVDAHKLQESGSVTGKIGIKVHN